MCLVPFNTLLIPLKETETGLFICELLMCSFCMRAKDKNLCNAGKLRSVILTLHWLLLLTINQTKTKKKVNRKVQEEPQGEVAANLWHQKEEKKWHR